MRFYKSSYVKSILPSEETNNTSLEGNMNARKLTDQQKIEIVEKYLTGKYNCSTLGEEYNVTKTSINRILRYRKVLILPGTYKKYTLNENYFDVIDTEAKAYWLGFLYSDGYNHEKSYSISLALQEKDKEILDKFNIDLLSNRPLRYKKKRKDSHQNVYCLSINNKHMSKQLAKLGCIQAKSLILKFPTEDQVPKHLLRHWLRGMWDGDGSFVISKSHSKTKESYIINSCIVGSINICDTISKYLKNELDINSNSRIIDKKSKSRRLTIQGNQQTVIFLNWLYSDCNLYLARKYKKYLDATEKLQNSGWVLTGKKSKLILLTYKGETKTIKEWSKVTGFSVTALRNRVRNNWTVERTLTEPIAGANS